MGLFKRAHVRGMAHELTRQGLVTWPSKQAEEEVADAVADQLPEEEVPEVTDGEGLSPEDAAKVVNTLVEVANEISEKTGGYYDASLTKVSASMSYEDAAANAALSVMYKAAEETAAGPDIPGQGTPTPASGATAETKVDAVRVPSSERVGPQGTSDLSTAGGAVGKEERRSDQPGAEANPPSGEVAKTSAVLDLLRKLSADGASLTGGEVKGKAPAPRKDLEDNLVIPGAVASSKGTSAQKVPESAMVGHLSKNPAGTPGQTAATPNELAKDAAVKAAAELLMKSAQGRSFLQKLSEECDKEEHEKKETKKEEKEEEQKEAIASALLNLSRAING